MRAKARDRQTTAHRAAHFSHCSINKRFHIKGQCRTKALYCYYIVLFINKYGQKLERRQRSRGTFIFRRQLLPTRLCRRVSHFLLVHNLVFFSHCFCKETSLAWRFGISHFLFWMHTFGILIKYNNILLHLRCMLN